MKSELLKTAQVDTRWIDENNYDLSNPLEVEANAVIALKLRRYIRSNGITQKELAKRLSVTPQFVCKLLSGKQNLGIGTALKYGQQLGIKLIEMPTIEEAPIKSTPYISMTVTAVRDSSVRNYSNMFSSGKRQASFQVNSGSRYVN